MKILKNKLLSIFMCAHRYLMMVWMRVKKTPFSASLTTGYHLSRNSGSSSTLLTCGIRGENRTKSWRSMDKPRVTCLLGYKITPTKTMRMMTSREIKIKDTMRQLSRSGRRKTSLWPKPRTPAASQKFRNIEGVATSLSPSRLHSHPSNQIEPRQLWKGNVRSLIKIW